MSDNKLAMKALAERLEVDVLQADVWFDIQDEGDTEEVERLEKAMDAVECAIEFLRNHS